MLARHTLNSVIPMPGFIQNLPKYSNTLPYFTTQPPTLAHRKLLQFLPYFTVLSLPPHIFRRKPHDFNYFSPQKNTLTRFYKENSEYSNHYYNRENLPHFINYFSDFSLFSSPMLPGNVSSSPGRSHKPFVAPRQNRLFSRLILGILFYYPVKCWTGNF